MTDALRSLPQSIRSAAFEDDGFASIQVTLTNFDLIALDAGLPIPADAPHDDEAEDRLLNILKESPVDRGGSGNVTVMPAGFPDGYGEFDEVEAELGFSLLSIRSMAEIFARPYNFTVLHGDLPISTDLTENAPGVFSTGDWPDGDLNMGRASAARPLGQTLHLGNRRIDGTKPTLGVSLHREFLEEWIAGDVASLADLPAYRELGGILDQARATTALLVEGDFTINPTQAQQDIAIEVVGITEPFAMIGLGSSTTDNRTTTTVAYSFFDNASAERALSSVEEVWTNGTSIVNTGQRFADRFDVKTVRQIGQAVVVTVGTFDDRTARTVYNAFTQQDSVFLHQ